MIDRVHPIGREQTLGSVSRAGISHAGASLPTTQEHLGPFHQIGLYGGLAWLFLIFGTIPELLSYLLHTNTYLLYLFAPATLVGVLLSGGIGRVYKNRAAWYWTLFFVCMIIVTPFSTWVGGSATRVLDYARFSFPLLLVTGGIATRWKDIRAVFYAIAMGGLVVLLAARFFTSQTSGRLNLDAVSTIGNPNDLAAHLIIILPFILFVAIDHRRAAALRWPLFIVLGFGIVTVLGTASRGGMIALAAAFLTLIRLASMRQRVMVGLCAAVMVVSSMSLIPGETKSRLASLFTGKDSEAEESQNSRSYLFRQSVNFTLEHPFMGVGPDQFSNFEGLTSRAAGAHGEWHVTHCAFTQVSSECGIPALMLFLCALGSALLSVYKTWRRARSANLQEISNACFCYLIAMAGFLTAITFLAQAYRFYLPAMVGLGISLSAVAAREMQRISEASSVAPEANWRPTVGTGIRITKPPIQKVNDLRPAPRRAE